MTFNTRAQHILFGLFCLPLLACGGAKSKSSLADIAIIPSKPIVITGDSVDDQDNKISAPWFSFRMRLTNGSNEAITVVAVTADVYATDASGGTSIKTVSFTPAEYNFTLGDSTECKYSSFGTIAAGGAATLGLANSITACTRVPVFIVGSNEKGNGSNFRYRVKAKPLGWFGTEDEATDRFERFFTFFTQ